MRPEIEAIFLDLGNTLRILIKDEAHMARARQDIVRPVGTDENRPDVIIHQFRQLLDIFPGKG